MGTPKLGGGAPDLVDRVAGLLLGAARAAGRLEHAPRYVARDLRVCLRLMRYRPLALDEFAYESGAEPEVRLNAQRQRDFAWRFMGELRELEAALKAQGGRAAEMGETAQLLRAAALYEDAEDLRGAAAGVWDRRYRGGLPGADEPDHLYWPGRAAIAAAAALAMYARRVPGPVEEDTEALQQFGRLVAFWAGALAAELVGWSAPATCVGPAAEAAQALVHGVIAMTCGDFRGAAPARVRTASDMLEMTLADAARGGAGTPRAELARDKKTLDEIRGFLGAFR